MIDTVYYHSSCVDGFGAALAVYKLYPDAKYIPVNYGDAVDYSFVENKSVAILDFSFPEDVMHTIYEKSVYLLWIDHHESALRRLEKWTASKQNDSKITVILDMKYSAAMLTWLHFHTSDAPDLIYHIQDYDLWRFHLFDTQAINYALRSHPFSFDLWTFFLRDDRLKQLRLEGKPIERWVNSQIDSIVARAWSYDLEGHNGMIVNCDPIFSSKVGNILAEKPHIHFGATYYEDQQYIYYSLRAVDRCNVAKLAEKYGGGGHKNAAGYKILKSYRSSICQETFLYRHW